MIKLRHNHPAWVDQRRRQFERDVEHKATDDGMSGSIIPFGAIYQWQSIEQQRLAGALAAPLPAWITSWNASGVALTAFCRRGRIMSASRGTKTKTLKWEHTCVFQRLIRRKGT